jgi:CcmD family protein
MDAMIPLLTVALIVWAGVFLFILSVDRRLRDVERRVRECAEKADTKPGKEMAGR